MAWEFLVAHFFHLVFLAWGLGGATVAAILMKKAEKEPDLMPATMRLLHPVSGLIWVAIIGLIITGIATSAMGAGKGYYDPTILLVKHIAVVLIIVLGLCITLLLLPKMKRLAPAPGSKPSPEFFKLKSQTKICSLLSLAMWYLVVVLSVVM